MRSFVGACVLLAGVLPAAAAAEDVIEFLSGAKVGGLVTKIDTAKQTVAFDAAIGGRTVSRVYPYSRIHAVTYNGRRYVLNEMNAAAPAGRGAADSPSRPTSVASLIEQAGTTPPDWFDQEPLDYPPSLDLSWPPKPPGNWNNQKNVGQYLWDIINPNPNRWRSGVKLVHHLLSMHQDDPEKRQRAMQTLGGMYFNLFQDYARAAFWWRKAGVKRGAPQAVALAECYWRLGDRKTAESLLVDPERPQANNSIYVHMIKLWGDMGQTAKAVKLAEMYVRAGGEPHLARLLAGDALRLAGQSQPALQQYQKVIDAPDGQNKKAAEREKTRARASMEAIRLFELSDVAKVADGRYRADSIGYSGPVEVEVEVRDGKLVAARVTRHVERQFYAALTDVPNQILKKQGVKGVDATSRATMTGEAIINATAKALAKGANK